MFWSLLKNTVHMQPFLFKMATVSSTSNRKFLTVEEVLRGLFADAYSSDETIESGSETEPSSSEEEDESDLAPLKITKIMLMKEFQKQEVVFQELIYIKKK